MTEEDIRLQEEAFLRSKNSREVEVTLFGNRNTVISVVTLLSYIRHAIQNNVPCTINLDVARNISHGDFDFMVNNEKVDDLITKESFSIN